MADPNLIDSGSKIKDKKLQWTQVISMEHCNINNLQLHNYDIDQEWYKQDDIFVPYADIMPQ